MQRMGINDIPTSLKRLKIKAHRKEEIRAFPLSTLVPLGYVYSEQLKRALLAAFAAQRVRLAWGRCCSVLQTSRQEVLPNFDFALIPPLWRRMIFKQGKLKICKNEFKFKRDFTKITWAQIRNLRQLLDRGSHQRNAVGNL